MVKNLSKLAKKNIEELIDTIVLNFGHGIYMVGLPFEKNMVFMPADNNHYFLVITDIEPEDFESNFPIFCTIRILK